MALAIDGGAPVRRAQWPIRQLFGVEAEELLLAVLHRQNLFSAEGELVGAFEKRFADLYGLEHGVACSSGTAAVHTALAACDIEPGSEVITAPITDAGTIVPILFQQAVPVFADVSESLAIDIADVRRKITPKTSAIVVVHLFGNAAEVDLLREIADEHRLALIEDCSQAHVTQYKGRYLGTFGHIGAFSLQQSKHMTTGEGGMVVTNDPRLARRAALFRDKGWARAGYGARCYEILGLNYRMTEMQAAVGIPQIATVRTSVERRMVIGDGLVKRLMAIPGIDTFPRTDGSEHSYWQLAFALQRWTPESFCRALMAEGIPARPRYIGEPIYQCMSALSTPRTFGTGFMPLRKTDSFARGLCPRAERVLEHMVVIPVTEALSDADARDVGDAIEKVAQLLPADASA